MAELGDYRFADDCEICGARIREHYERTIWRGEHIFGWVREEHELNDCVRELAQRISFLENR